MTASHLGPVGPVDEDVQRLFVDFFAEASDFQAEIARLAGAGEDLSNLRSAKERIERENHFHLPSF